MKFELFLEHASHYTMCLVILAIFGMLLPAVSLMVGGGHIIVTYFDVPHFGFGKAEAKVLYGALTFICFTLATKAWMIESCVNEWITWNRVHADTVARLKYGPDYFRRRIAA